MGKGTPLGVVLAMLLVTGCTGGPPPGPVGPRASPAAAAPTVEVTPAPTPAPTAAPEPGTVPPAWLGTRVLPQDAAGYGAARPTPRALRERRFTLPDQLPELPGTGFAARVADPAPDDVIARSTWAPGCPVGREELAWVRLTFRGFDGTRHTGELLVNGAVARDLVGVFRELWRADVPIEQMQITSRAELDQPPTGDGNNTGAFVCRPVTGGMSYSQHAYGLAIDVDPFQNPYSKGDLVLPELASAYLDRDDVRPGMHLPDGPVVRAFRRIGWSWGGDYDGLKDYQHFSATGG